MLNLNSPDRWIWVLAALPIVAFYLLKTRIRRRPVATLLFWEQVFHQKRPRVWGTQLRHLGSLLLQLAFLGLLVGALLDPLGAGQKKQTRQIVLVLDSSASMQARDADGIRWDAAIQAAERELSSMRAGDEIALVTAGSPPRVIVGMTEFGPSIRQAVRDLQPTDAPAAIRPALDTARQLATDPQRRDIVLISDGCFTESTYQHLQKASDTRLQRVGQAIDNLAITQFQTRRSLADPIGYAVLIEIVNHADAPQPAECRLTLELDEQLVDVLPLRLQPGERWRKTFEYADARGGVLAASLDVNDALTIDNRAVAILPSRPLLPVNLVSETTNVFLAGALSSIPRVQLTTSQQAIVPQPPRGIAVFHRLVPQQLPAGPLLFIDPQQDSPFWTLGPPIDQPLVVRQDAQSPLLAHVQLTNVSLPGARPLEMVPDSTPLLSTVDGSPVMTSLLDTQGPQLPRRIVVLSTPVDDGDLPLRVAFPVMMANAINWLANESPQLQPAVSTGQTPLPTDAGGTPQGPLQTQGPLQHVGVQVIEALSGNSESDDRASVRLAVNLANAEESDLRPHVPPTPATTTADETTATNWIAGRSGWFTLCLLALGLIVGEWVLYQRRMVS